MKGGTLLSKQKIRVPIRQIRKVIIALLHSYGITFKDATIIANSFIDADVCGVSTHGIAVLPAHLEKLSAGGYHVRPNIRKVKAGAGFAVVDGDGAMGPLSAHYCMKLAIKEAKEKGSFCVFSYNNNTLGPAFHYSMMATAEGMIGLVMCNTPPAMAPWNGQEKLLGTNPFSIAIPVKGREPIVLDMATSQVAKSKLNMALKEGKAIPLGWAVDQTGHPTTDPLEGIKGMVLPMGGYKGYGIAMMIDILAGVLSGAAFLNKVGSFYRELDKCMNVGYMCAVLNPPDIFGDSFYEMMQEYYNTIKSSASAVGEKIQIPGDQKAYFKKLNQKLGIPLKPDTVRKLIKYSADQGIALELLETWGL